MSANRYTALGRSSKAGCSGRKRTACSPGRGEARATFHYAAVGRSSARIRIYAAAQAGRDACSSAGPSASGQRNGEGYGIGCRDQHGSS